MIADVDVYFLQFVLLLFVGCEVVSGMASCDIT